MTQNTPAYLSAMPPEIQELLGPPPLLSTEDASRYWKILNNFAQCVQARDFIEWMWVRDLTDERWEIERLRHFKHELVEQIYRANVARKKAGTEAGFVAEVWGLSATARSVLLGGQQLEAAAKTEREKKLNADIDNLTTKTAKRLEELNKAPSSADFARTAEEWLLCYERLEKLQRAAEYAFEGVLEQIELHRAGLGLRLREACDQVIEGEFEEAPSQWRPDEVSPPSSPSEDVESKRSASTSSAKLTGIWLRTGISQRAAKK